ncbi:FAD-binding protein [Bacillus sp. SL00103]
MGGICVNENGETTVPSLFAIGEAACTAYMERTDWRVILSWKVSF